MVQGGKVRGTKNSDQTHTQPEAHTPTTIDPKKTYSTAHESIEARARELINDRDWHAEAQQFMAAQANAHKETDCDEFLGDNMMVRKETTGCRITSLNMHAGTGFTNMQNLEEAILYASEEIYP